jgi:hypothetical protein
VPASILICAALNRSASPSSTGLSFRFRAANIERGAALESVENPDTRNIQNLKINRNPRLRLTKSATIVVSTTSDRRPVGIGRCTTSNQATPQETQVRRKQSEAILKTRDAGFACTNGRHPHVRDSCSTLQLATHRRVVWHDCGRSGVIVELCSVACRCEVGLEMTRIRAQNKIAGANLGEPLQSPMRRGCAARLALSANNCQIWH